MATIIKQQKNILAHSLHLVHKLPSHKNSVKNYTMCCNLGISRGNRRSTNLKFNKISPGISLKTFLTQVRAKQAARALEAMTRSPAQAKEAVRLTRLPEIARILRNLFVAEKKGVLTREQVLCKLSDSYRESLSHG